MAAPKRVREARARLDELLAKKFALLGEAAALEDQRKPFVAKLNAIDKRLSKTQVIAFLAGRYEISSLARFRAETGYNSTLEPKVKPLTDGLTGGGIKITGGYGVSYTAKGLAPRIRLIEPVTFRAYGRAAKARIRAEAALKRAQAAEAAAIKAAFEAGAKVSLDVLVTSLVTRAIAYLRFTALPVPDTRRSEAGRLDGWEGSPVAQAKMHLAHAESGSDEACPCATCIREAREASEQKAESERRSTLPRIAVTCLDHGRKRMAWEHRTEHLTQERFDGLGLAAFGLVWDYYRSSFVIPVAYCPVDGKAYVVKSILEAEQKARAKAAAKAAKPAKPVKVVTGASEGDTVAFTCPNCGAEGESEVYTSEEDGELRVGCVSCEMEPLAAAVVVTSIVKGGSKAA